MPKPLSLKKAVPSKSQKSITAFFSGPKIAINNPSHTKSNEEKSDKDLLSSQTSIKRKALSPLPETKKRVLNSQAPTNLENHHKKQKLHKENGQQSPSKEIDNDGTTKEINVKKSPEKMSRSPLCSVVNNHINIDNHVNEDIDNNFKESPSKNVATPTKYDITPKKYEQAKVRRSPRIAKLKTPEKATISPAKHGLAKKSLEFEEQFEDSFFEDDWNPNDVEENLVEDLNLSSLQRCEVLSVQVLGTAKELQLKNSNNQRGTCFIEGVWFSTPVMAGDIVSVTAARDGAGRLVVNNTDGLLVLRPDHLMSTTSVVAGVFCQRKSVLQERFRGIDSANDAMTIGILIHELVQKALLKKTSDVATLRKETQDILNESISMLYDAGLSVEEASTNMEAYIQPLADFMKSYVVAKTPPGGKDKWPGVIDEVLDIEENVCCPALGLKGKIDATLQVTIHERKGRKKSEVPLELKSGRASGSAEHRGQLLLYCMMLGLRRAAPDTALLLYLRDRVDLREVKGGHPERRDLIMLRNQLVLHLTPSPEDIDPESLTDVEEASNVLSQKLPDPISFENACSKCAYLTVCSLHLWHTSGPAVPDSHPLSRLRAAALGHVAAPHVAYFLQWNALISLEERAQASAAPLHWLWTEDAETRKKRGVCANNMKLKSVEPSGDRFLHVFLKPKEDTDADGADGADGGKQAGPQEGEFCVVSAAQPWLAAGAVQRARGGEYHVLLERDLSRRLSKQTLYELDSYSSVVGGAGGAGGAGRAGLAALLEDSDRARRLREIIIDKLEPEFDKKLSREVGRLGTKLMRCLNIEQQRAVLKALAAQHYALLQGLPGTGKTQTISVLIQMLVALKQRVLVTAHTHSAVDTVLQRLPANIKVLRLGAAARVAAGLRARCERPLVAHCRTPEQLAQTYDSMEVVGVTCLGAAHALLARTTFDVCIVDEATQVLQCTVIRPLLAAKRFVLVGDPEQLPPVVKSRAARRLGMEESLFHRLAGEGGSAGGAAGGGGRAATLRLQYRMNSSLAALANAVSYGGRLRCASAAVRDAALSADVTKIESLYGKEAPWLLEVCSQKPEDAAIFVDMDSMTYKPTGSKSLSNANEACVVLAILDALIKAGVSGTDIGVIAPYREQVSLLQRAALAAAPPGPEASTVDQFQGRDKSVIVYSCTRSDGDQDKTVKEGEVLNDQRRLAVSVTRAKHKLIVVGHALALRRYSPVQRMIDACKRVSLQESDKTFLTKYASYVV